MPKKKLTLIICSFNNSKYLKKCLKSVFNQSVSENNYDVILVDDKSTDNSLEVANLFQNEKNFKIIKNKKNIGLVKSCNSAIKVTNTNFFVRVDSDDYISKNFVKNFLRYIEKDYDLILSNYIIIKNKKIKKININMFKLEKMISCSVALKTKIVKKIGGYRNFFWEEHDLYLRYIKKSKKIYRIKKYLYFYRFHKNNMTRLASWKEKAWEQLFKKHNVNYVNKLEKNFIFD